MGVEKFNLPRHPCYQDKMVMRTHFKVRNTSQASNMSIHLYIRITKS